LLQCTQRFFCFRITHRFIRSGLHAEVICGNDAPTFFRDLVFEDIQTVPGISGAASLTVCGSAEPGLLFKKSRGQGVELLWRRSGGRVWLRNVFSDKRSFEIDRADLQKITGVSSDRDVV